MKTNDYEILKEFEVFSFLNKEEQELISKHLFYRTYKKNQILFTEGDPRERIYFLIDGFVKLEKTNVEATTTYTYYIKPKELFPYRGMFNDEYYNISASALTDVVLYYIPTKVFEVLVKNNKEQLSYIINQLSHIIGHHENRIQIFSLNHVREKVELSIAHLMKYYGEENGCEVKVDLPMTIKELSMMLGISRESVSACVGDLQKERLVSVINKNINIHDPHYFHNKLA